MAEQFSSHRLLHVAAKDLNRCNVEMILKRAYNLEIRNIFALRGGKQYIFFIILFTNHRYNIFN